MTEDGDQNVAIHLKPLTIQGNAMSSDAINSKPRRILIWIFTCCTATAIGAFLGGLSAARYDLELGAPDGSLAGIAGIWSGTISGLIAAICWCLIVFARYDRCPQRFRTGYGMIAGIAVGISSGVSVHVTLMLATGSSQLFGVLLGVTFGLAAGAALGAFCGSLFRVPNHEDHQSVAE